jgi:hypothetical protein
MLAQVVPDAIVILTYHILPGEIILETSCPDYETFKRLPQAVSFDGQVCGKTGWNSDRGIACYKSGCPIASKVK